VGLPELYILRHGQTVWNREKRMQGDLDSPLTAQGVAQARAMGALLRAEGVTATSHAVYSSPLGRALHTAELALGIGRAAIRADRRLAEIGVGGWTGLTRAEIVAATPALSMATPLLDIYRAAPGGEPFARLWDRAAAVLAEIAGPAVMVTHGITARVLRAVAMGKTLADLPALPGGQGVVFRIRDGRHETLIP